MTDNILTPEFFRLVASVDISTPEKLAQFKAWQNNDGTIDGLRKLIEASAQPPDATHGV